jgi:hypothetical protein
MAVTQSSADVPNRILAQAKAGLGSQSPGRASLVVLVML